MGGEGEDGVDAGRTGLCRRTKNKAQYISSVQLSAKQKACLPTGSGRLKSVKM